MCAEEDRSVERASGYSNGFRLFVVNDSGREAERLLKIFLLEKWVLGENRSAVRIGGQEFQHATNGDSHSADARLPSALTRLNSNPIELIYRGHVPSLKHSPTKDGKPHRLRPLVHWTNLPCFI